ncbi:hypothetical protein [Alteromonas sp. a30]|uniref:hypothetical protein n=1 Tax=Alteromonas sp. a30 TaxID=2730917 RepID=UPI0022818F05|nr:hypothetical protein [Alteromonas sp. a30]MCY7297266.1 hypothetical protein [Alteromonas sp. a30]
MLSSIQIFLSVLFLNQPNVGDVNASVAKAEETSVSTRNICDIDPTAGGCTIVAK